MVHRHQKLRASQSLMPGAMDFQSCTLPMALSVWVTMPKGHSLQEAS